MASKAVLVGVSSAFIASGRLKVTVATPPSRSHSTGAGASVPEDKGVGG